VHDEPATQAQGSDSRPPAGDAHASRRSLQRELRPSGCPGPQAAVRTPTVATDEEIDHEHVIDIDIDIRPSHAVASW